MPTLEEIERESAKLSEEERAALAARFLESRESPVAETEQCLRPSCMKPTKRIEIERDAADWARVQFLGSFTAVHPDKERAKVCEHCGHVFDQQLLTNPVTDRFAQFIFYVIPGIGMIWVIWMLVKAVMA